jgi:hypothetical protein
MRGAVHHYSMVEIRAAETAIAVSANCAGWMHEIAFCHGGFRAGAI